MNKIISLKELDQIKRNGKKLVLCGGCFDIVHVGHVRFLEAAKNSGDILVVALEPDQKVQTLKGENRPINSQQERAELLAALEMVDFVILLPELKTDRDYFSLVKTIKPNLLAVTENDPLVDKKKQQIELVEGKLAIIPKINTPSTSQLTKLLGID